MIRTQASYLGDGYMNHYIAIMLDIVNCLWQIYGVPDICSVPLFI
jgi:hypothetical protein